MLAVDQEFQDQTRRVLAFVFRGFSRPLNPFPRRLTIEMSPHVRALLGRTHTHKDSGQDRGIFCCCPSRPLACPALPCPNGRRHPKAPAHQGLLPSFVPVVHGVPKATGIGRDQSRTVRPWWPVRWMSGAQDFLRDFDRAARGVCGFQTGSDTGGQSATVNRDIHSLAYTGTAMPPLCQSYTVLQSFFYSLFSPSP